MTLEKMLKKYPEVLKMLQEINVDIIQFQLYHKQYCINKKLKFNGFLIENIFRWSKTKEGFYYWANKSIRYKALFKKYIKREGL
jgi:hypothetical protein